MGRIAGNDPGYTFRLCRVDGGLIAKPTKYGFTMPSVSTFIGEVLAKPASAMAWWGYRIGLKGVHDALADDVTRVIDSADPEELEAFLKERGVNPNMKLEEAGGRGTDAHTVLELLATGEHDAAAHLADKETLEAGTRYGEALFDWWNTQIAPAQERGAITRIMSEVPVWSLKHWYAGTFDLAVEWQNRWEIIDLKTHKPASGFTKPGFGPGYISDITQIRAYRMAFEEMGFGQTIAQRVVVAREKPVKGVSWLEDTRTVPERFVELLREAYDHKTTFEKGEDVG